MKMLMISAAAALMMSTAGAAFAQNNNNSSQNNEGRTNQMNCEEAANAAASGNLTFKCPEGVQATDDSYNGVDSTGSTSAPVIDSDEGDPSRATER